MKVKIIKIILLILLLLSILVFSYLFIKNNITINNIKSLESERTIIDNDNKDIIDNKLELEEMLNNITNETKEQISEYQIWVETNQKIKKIIG